MIIRIEDLKDISQIILSAVDNSELSVLTETLELKVENNILYMNVTNREYYAQVKLVMSDEEEDFHATVNANLFLKLVSQITTDTVEFSIVNNSLVIKANGIYKLPLIYDNELLLELPVININNVTTEFDIDSNILTSIYNYNSKQLLTSGATKPVQKMYYVDEKGAITFTTGACINNFSLEKPIKILLTNKIVKLFKLFKNNNVHFTLGYDAISNNIIQTKVKFESDNISITAILSCDDTIINSVPVTAIRNRADSSNYKYFVTFNKELITETINRLLLFTFNSKFLNASGKFVFGDSSVTITDVSGENKEVIHYSNEISNITEYTAILDLNDLKMVLDTCTEQYINFMFGDEQAILICRGNIVNVIPELHTA